MAPPLRLLVCGSREWTDIEPIRRAMDQAIVDHGPMEVLIHGTCRGPDTIAGDIAQSWGVHVEAYPALWNTYGKRAGYLRNAQMLKEGKPTLVLAFPVPGSRGTHMMIGLTHAAGIPIIVRDNRP
ncbi:hypothetical protein LCGC14_1712410 [marine sediment metagenome]|uniref:YspA cpYpsA-related SLOG domain-containing protein n=1 Tax=marine sediment metagenome TaxID=412755 RepID=A0A0F9HEG1_9ZZZZ